MTAPILPIAQYAARSKDDAVLRVSSSGGVFTELARVVLARRGVVVASGWNRETMTVEHRCVETEAELADLRGSKYVTSDMSGVYGPMERFVSAGREILFVGTPCQVAAIRRRFGSPKNMTLCAIVCHSNVPADVWALYRDEVQKRLRARIVDVRFRDKRAGWRKSTLCIFTSDPMRSFFETLYENQYMRVFFSGWATRAACFNCMFRAGRSGADLLIGDFWGVEDVLPSLDDGKGVSAVLIYTQTGRGLLLASSLILFGITYQQVVIKNPFILVSPQTDAVKRARFQRIYRMYGLQRAMRYAEYGSLSREILVRGYRFARRVLGNVTNYFAK